MAKRFEYADKICVICQKPFSWRKKWERDWEAVLYCSKKCAMLRKSLRNKIKE
jgi:hypothetical protein